MKKSSTQDFIKKAQQIHGNKYDYSKVKYETSSQRICIICPIHGEFWQLPNNHLSKKQGCPKCQNRQLNDSEIIRKFIDVHGDRYDYSKVKYMGSKRSVCIICPIHGEFEQLPIVHLRGSGCPKCGNENKRAKLQMNKDMFIEKSKTIHNGKYIYPSDLEYVNNQTAVEIICPKHGIFKQTPNSHLQGSGCPKCAQEKVNTRKKTYEEFITEANIVHKNKYDYTKTIYNGNKNKVEIICPIHGSFFQTPHNHLLGQGCPLCSKEVKRNKRRYTTEKFIELANKKHCNKYDYSKVSYIDSKTKVTIVCPQHGDFKQVPRNHLKGAGCPKCRMSHLEREIMSILSENNITFEYQSKINGLLGRQTVDFYIPKENVAIECQGKQHFHPTFGNDIHAKEKVFKTLQENDKKKYRILTEANINVLYIIENNIQIDENNNITFFYRDNTLTINVFRSLYNNTQP